MINAADQRQVKKAKQRERWRRESELRDLSAVCHTREGRRFVWRTLTASGVFRVSFVQGEPESTAFNEGRRSLGLSLMADLHELDPSLYGRMGKEALDEEKKQAEPAAEADPQPTTEEIDNA